MIWAPSLSPLERQVGIGARVDPLVEPPEPTREVAEVRIDAERQVGEVAQPAHHPGHMVDGEAVDQEGVDAHLLEATGRPAEEVALGRTPMLAVDAANTVPAAPEREPDRQSQFEEAFDEGEGVRLADERERLEEQEVGRLVCEDPLEKLRRSVAGERLGLLGDGEGNRAGAGHGLRRRSPRKPDTRSGDIHPVHEPHLMGIAARARRRAPTRCRSRSRHSRLRRRSGGRPRPPRAPGTGATSPRYPPRPRGSPAGGSAGAPSLCRRRARHSVRRRASARQHRTGGVPCPCSPSRSAHDTPRHSLSGWALPTR